MTLIQFRRFIKAVERQADALERIADAMEREELKW